MAWCDGTSLKCRRYRARNLADLAEDEEEDQDFDDDTTGTDVEEGLKSGDVERHAAFATEIFAAIDGMHCATITVADSPRVSSLMLFHVNGADFGTSSMGRSWSCGLLMYVFVLFCFCLAFLSLSLYVLGKL